MAGVSKIRELEARKRALVTESELCREALKAEVENLRHYSAGFFQKIDRVRSFGPWLMLAAPVAIPLFRLFSNRAKPAATPRSSGLKGGLAALMLGVRLFRQYAPLVSSLASQFLARRRASEGQSRSVNS
jgi:hypothetical protein